MNASGSNLKSRPSEEIMMVHTAMGYYTGNAFDCFLKEA